MPGEVEGCAGEVGVSVKRLRINYTITKSNAFKFSTIKITCVKVVGGERPCTGDERKKPVSHDIEDELGRENGCKEEVQLKEKNHDE